MASRVKQAGAQQACALHGLCQSGWPLYRVISRPGSFSHDRGAGIRIQDSNSKRRPSISLPRLWRSSYDGYVPQLHIYARENSSQWILFPNSYDHLSLLRDPRAGVIAETPSQKFQGLSTGPLANYVPEPTRLEPSMAPPERQHVSGSVQKAKVPGYPNAECVG